MDIGIVSENRASEKRVILRPQELKSISSKCRVLVEKGLGKGVGIEDKDYEEVGAKVADTKKVYSCKLIIRLKEPREEELSLMKPNSYIMCMLHLSGSAKLKNLLKKYKINGIAMEKVKDQFGNRMIEALYYSGYLGMDKGLELWGKNPSKAVIKIMGYGNVAFGAIQCASRKFVHLEILNRLDFKNMKKHIPGTDILVNAIKWPIEKRGKEFFITKKMLKLFKKGSVILDLISNPKGQSPIETMHPTYLDDISYVVDGVIHTSCWSWPGLDPVNISRRYSIQIEPILNDIVNRSLSNLPKYIKEAVYKV